MALSEAGDSRTGVCENLPRLAEPRRYSSQGIAACDGAIALYCPAQKPPGQRRNLLHHVKELGNAGLIQIVREGKFATLSCNAMLWRLFGSVSKILVRQRRAK